MSLADVYAALGLSEPPAAVLWDMDGTIVDTEADWVNNSRKVVEAHGGYWDDADGNYIFGACTADHAQRLADAVARGTGPRLAPMRLFDLLHQEMRTAYQDAELLPGAAEMLTAFLEAGIPQALVTATEMDLVIPALQNFPQEYFAAVVSGSEKIPGKPSPEPYLLGAQRLQADIRDCLVFEDSAAGLAAARASGAVTIDVNEIKVADLAKLL
ncbi:MAG: HAD family hydrolase [Trueperella sp.]|nr:HAD family hydrolase [Trueperella sp.]